jgi:hypothetical protein
MDKKTQTVLEGALRKGNCIHAFLSGGGLRVIRIEKKARNGTLVGYGEHPDVEDALKHAAEDFTAGGRPYDKVYGPKGLYAHYLTGSTSTASALDAWVRRGSTFDIHSEGDDIVVELKGHAEFHTSEADLARARRGETVLIEQRGYTYESKAGPDGGVSTRVVKSPEGNRKGSDPWMWHTVQVGRAAKLADAIELALNAEPNEDHAHG